MTDVKETVTGRLTGRLVVCERSGEWATALRRQIPSGEASLRQVRSSDDAWQVFSEFPASFFVWELVGERLGDQLTRLVELRRRFPRTQVAVIASREMIEMEWSIREAGALHVSFSIRNLNPLVRLARRHLRLVDSCDPNLRQQILSELPWT